MAERYRAPPSGLGQTTLETDAHAFKTCFIIFWRCVKPGQAAILAAIFQVEILLKRIARCGK